MDEEGHPVTRMKEGWSRIPVANFTMGKFCQAEAAVLLRAAQLPAKEEAEGSPDATGRVTASAHGGRQGHNINLSGARGVAYGQEILTVKGHRKIILLPGNEGLPSREGPPGGDGLQGRERLPCEAGRGGLLRET
jgi:hypothetical protein